MNDHPIDNGGGRLSQLFSEYAPDTYATMFQRALSISQRPENIIVFGAGNLGTKVASLMQIAGYTVVGFCDNNKPRIGDSKNGIPVFTPAELQKLDHSTLVVVGIWSYNHSFRETSAQLAANGFNNVLHCLVPLVLFQQDKNYLPNYCLDNPEKLRTAADELHDAEALLRRTGDAKSVEVFEQVVAFFLNPVAENVPLPGDRKVFRELPDEVYVDCGAFIGETVTKLIEARGGELQSVYCFEPDRFSFERLRDNLGSARMKGSAEIHFVNAAVGSETGSVSFTHTGTWGSSVSGMNSEVERVDAFALDDFPWSTEPTLIKMDIEGQELEALKGSQSFIRNSRTVLSITAEHRMEDLWEIPLYLNSINPDRDIYLVAQDSEIGMDLVYYSVPKERRNVTP